MNLDRNQLPHLIRLLEDTSESVQGHVAERLLAFGDRLEAEFSAIQMDVSPEDRSRFRRFLAAHGAEARRKGAWRAWQTLETSPAQLEGALEVLSQYQFGWSPPIRLKEMLVDLAKLYAQSGYSNDPYGLSRFLFVGQAFRGTAEDYYNPLNSNLAHVIQEKRGIPISLACVFILVGARSGLDIWGVNTPGHFLAAASVAGRIKLFDCFSHGRALTPTEESILRHSLPPQLSYVLGERATAKQIVVRMLRNLINAYERLEQEDRANVFRSLLADVNIEKTD
jgi:regulator of sirC expression with transglutaminase-like and TPR domain